MYRLNVVFKLSIFLGLLLFLENSRATNVTTILQLRKSVDFSYAGANLFLNLIRGEPSKNVTKEVIESAISVANEKSSLLLMNTVFSNFPGYMACILFGIIFAVFMPLIGLFFCCIRCCGKCGGSVSQMDRKRDPCRRVTYSIFLAIITTVQLLAIILAFINCHLFYKAVLSSSPEIGTLPQIIEAANQFELGINMILEAAKNTSTVNLDDQKMKFDAMFDDGLTAFQRDFVANTSAADVIRLKDQFQNVVAKYGPNTATIEEWNNFIDTLRRFEENLPGLNSEISELLNTRCMANQLTACRKLRDTTTNKLVANFELTQFQSVDVSRLFKEIKLYHEDVIRLNEFNETLLGMKNDIREKLQPILNNAWNDLSNSPETRQDLVKSMQEVAENVHNELNSLRKNLESMLREAEKTKYKPIQEFALYSGIAFLCLSVLIILLYYLGLCFGACGDRPYNEAGLCNRGVGANLLMSGVSFTFLFSTLLMLVCMSVFLVGGLMQTEFCRYTTTPNGPAFLDSLIVDIVDVVRTNEHKADYGPVLEAFLKLRPVDLLLVRCASEPLVDAVGTENIARLISKNSIDMVMDNLLNTFNKIDLIAPLQTTAKNTQTILSQVSRLREFNFSSAIAQCNQPLTKIENIDEYLKDLRSLNIQGLDSYIKQLSDEMLMLRLRLNHTRSVYVELDTLEPLYAQLVESLTEFSKELDFTVPNSIKMQIDNMRPLFLRELRLAVIATWRTIPCTDLHVASMSGVQAVCVTFLWPLNGFWVGLGACILLFIPGLIFAVKLINLYRKTEKYSPDYLEPDYMSFQGFYMRPSGDVDVQQPRKRKPSKKSKKSQPRGKNSSDGYGFNYRHGPTNSNYQPVSVYPYDAYE